MTALTITSPAELEALTASQINEIAQHSLTWDTRYVESMYRQGESGQTYRWNSNHGHSEYENRGYPAGYSGKTFSSRREYLTHRLTERIRRTGAVYDAEGAEAAKAEQDRIKAEKKAAREREIAERATKSQAFLDVAVKAAFAERIPFYAKPHKINMYREGERTVMHRSTNSEGTRICQEKIKVNTGALKAAVEALNENKDVLKSIAPSIPDVKGVSFEAPALAGIKVDGDNPDGYNYSSDLVFNWDAKNDGHILVQVQAWTFRFHIDDFAATIANLDTEWVAVAKTDSSANEASVEA